MCGTHSQPGRLGNRSGRNELVSERIQVGYMDTSETRSAQQNSGWIGEGDAYAETIDWLSPHSGAGGGVPSPPRV